MWSGAVFFRKKKPGDERFPYHPALDASGSRDFGGRRCNPTEFETHDFQQREDPFFCCWGDKRYENEKIKIKKRFRSYHSVLHQLSKRFNLLVHLLKKNKTNTKQSTSPHPLPKRLFYLFKVTKTRRWKMKMNYKTKQIKNRKKTLIGCRKHWNKNPHFKTINNNNNKSFCYEFFKLPQKKNLSGFFHGEKSAGEGEREKNIKIVVGGDG